MKNNAKKQMNNGQNAHPLTMYAKKIARESMGGMVMKDVDFPKAINLFGEDNLERVRTNVTKFVGDEMKAKGAMSDEGSHAMFMYSMLVKSICDGMIDKNTDQERINKSFLSGAIECAKIWGAL